MSDTAMDAVVGFIKDRNPAVEVIDKDDDLIDSRAIDSLAFVDFIFLLEELGGTILDPEELDVEDFRTLRRIEARFLSGASHG
jgi:acyl carrier protein